MPGRPILFTCAYAAVASRAGRALRVALAILQRRAAEIRVARAAGLAGAHRAVVERRAIGAVSANVRERARIDTLVIHAHVRLAAIAMVLALYVNALRLGG